MTAPDPARVPLTGDARTIRELRRTIGGLREELRPQKMLLAVNQICATEPDDAVAAKRLVAMMRRFQEDTEEMYLEEGE